MYIKSLIDLMVCGKKIIFHRQGPFYRMPETVFSHEMLNYIKALLFLKELKREIKLQ